MTRRPSGEADGEADGFAGGSGTAAGLAEASRSELSVNGLHCMAVGKPLPGRVLGPPELGT